MSRGLCRIDRAILARIEEGRTSTGVGWPPHGAHVSSGQLFWDCYPNPKPGFPDHREPTPVQRKSVSRAMHAIVRKFPQYALMGGEGQTPLWLCEPGDPESTLWAELSVKYGRHGFVPLADVRKIAAGNQPTRSANCAVIDRRFEVHGWW